MPSKYGCTVCGCLIVPSEMTRHPILGTLQCIPCRVSYSHVVDLSRYRNGVDKEFHDNYCRWCLDGGDLVLCSDQLCYNGFCNNCIERNFGKEALEAINKSTAWFCFLCDDSQLAQKRKEADEAISQNEPRKPTSFNLFSSSRLLSKLNNIRKEVPEEVQPVVEEPVVELPKETPTNVAKETPTNVAKEGPTNVAKEGPTNVAKETPKEVPMDVCKEVTSSGSVKAPEIVPQLPAEDLEKELFISDDSDDEAGLKNVKASEPQGDTSETKMDTSNGVKGDALDDSKNEAIITAAIQEALVTARADDLLISDSDIIDHCDVEPEKPVDILLDVAVRNADSLNNRLKTFIDSLTKSHQTYDEKKFRSDPVALASWLSNIEIFMDPSPFITKRCQHIMESLQHRGFDRSQ